MSILEFDRFSKNVKYGMREREMGRQRII